MTTATKATKKTTPHPATLPTDLEVPAEVAEQSHMAAEKLNYHRSSIEALAEAEEKQRTAEADDITATRKAIEEGKTPPPSCLPERDEQVKAARRTMTAAQEIARESVNELEAAISRNEQALIDTQRTRVDEAAKAAEEHLAKFNDSLAVLSAEGGLLHGLLHKPSDNEQLRARTGGRGVAKLRRNFKPLNLDNRGHIPALRTAVLETYERAAGLGLMILDTVREANRPLTSSDITAKLGLTPLDQEFGAIKEELVTSGELIRCDRDGNPRPAVQESGYLTQDPHYKIGEPKRKRAR